MRGLATLLVPALFASSIAACRQVPKKDGSASEVDGLVNPFARKVPIPSPKSTLELRGMLKSLVEHGTSQVGTEATFAVMKQSLKAGIFENVVSIGGLPRWQLDNLLSELLADTNRLCGGASCARVFGVKADEVDGFLDDLYSEAVKHPELKKAENAQKRIIILGSLQRDVTPDGKPTARASIQNSYLERDLMAALGIDRPLTNADLDQITELKIDTWTWGRERNKPDFSELAKLKKLRKLSLSYGDQNIVKDIPQYARTLEHLELKPFHHIEFRMRVFRMVPYQEIDSLATVSHIKSLGIIGFNFEDAPMLAMRFFHLTSLRVEGGTAVTKTAIDSFGSMPNLRKLSLGAPYRTLDSEATLAKSVPTVEFRATDGSCGDLTGLRVFAKAANMTVVGCSLSALGGGTIPFDWKILSLISCRAESGAPTKLPLPSNLDNLTFFRTDHPEKVDLDEAGKHLVTVHLAQSQQP